VVHLSLLAVPGSSRIKTRLPTQNQQATAQTHPPSKGVAKVPPTNRLPKKCTFHEAMAASLRIMGGPFLLRAVVAPLAFRGANPKRK
jgi:hypothetical protein